MSENKKAGYDDEQYDISWVFKKQKDEAAEEEAENFFWKYHGADNQKVENVSSDSEAEVEKVPEGIKDEAKDEPAEDLEKAKNSIDKEEPEIASNLYSDSSEGATTSANDDELVKESLKVTLADINSSAKEDPLRIPEALGGEKQQEPGTKKPGNKSVKMLAAATIFFALLTLALCSALIFLPKDSKKKLDAIKIAAAEINTGDMLLLDLVNHPKSAYRLLNTGNEDSRVSNMLYQLVKEGDTAIDIGSGHGYYSFHVSRLVGKTGRVHSIEANARLAALQRKSVRMNGARNILVHNRLLNSKNGNVRVDHASKDRKLLILDDNAKADLDIYRSVKLDAIVSKLKEASVIHINARGNEVDILAGALQLIKRSPNIKILTTWYQPRSAKINTEKFIKYVLSLGLQFWSIDPTNNSLVPMKNISDIIDSEAEYFVIAKNL